MRVFFLPDAAHSQRERRFRAIGRTDKARGVFIVFTLRHKGDELLIRLFRRAIGRLGRTFDHGVASVFCEAEMD